MSISYLASYTFNTSSLCLFLYLSLSFYIYLTIVSVEVNISIYWYRRLKDSWLWLDNKIDRKIDDTAMQFLLVQNTWLNPDWIRANGLSMDFTLEDGRIYFFLKTVSSFISNSFRLISSLIVSENLTGFSKTRTN